MANVTTAQQTEPKKHDELILVVKRSHIFPHESWNGLRKVNFDDYLTVIQKHQEFHPRSLMEQEPVYKQIIPYLVFTHNGDYFLMERHAKASEQRLKSKLSLGIGGHIRQEDMESSDIFEWARREFYEEVSYDGDFTITPLGILNDDSNDVGKVHVGFVFLLEGTSPEITVKSELQDGRLVRLQDCIDLKERMETWSQFVVDHLAKNHTPTRSP